MKKLYLAFVFSLLTCIGLKAQNHFLADFQVVGNVMIFKVKAVGTITDGFNNMDFCLRWDKGFGNTVTFTNIQVNTVDFPSLTIIARNNSQPDAQYNNEVFTFPGIFNTPSNTYNDGQVYEVFRVTLGGTIPGLVQMVADNSGVSGQPYYFDVYSGGADYTPYDIDPFVSSAGNDGPFYWANYALVVLPITMKDFTGNVVNCNARLEWTTSTEVESKSFEVQTSSNGIDFRGISTVPVPTAGNSTEWHYTAVVPFSGSAVYYRLKMTDLDNVSKYSKTILLKDAKCSVPAELYLKISPNPVERQKIRLMLTAGSADRVTINISDLSGKIIMRYQQQLIKGANQITIPLPSVASGQYMLHAQTDRNNVAAQKIFVL